LLAVLEKLVGVQIIDVWIPTVDGRWLILPRYTQPEAETNFLLEKLNLETQRDFTSIVPSSGCVSLIRGPAKE
jgi:hypothetical protein